MFFISLAFSPIILVNLRVHFNEDIVDNDCKELFVEYKECIPLFLEKGIRHLYIYTIAFRMRNIFVQFVCALFILLFVYAGLSKLIDFEIFSAQLKRSPILSPQARFFSVAVPVTEFVISVMLILPRWQLWGLYGSFSLMFLFTGYIIAITRFSDDVPCSCGGVLQNMSWDEHVVFNIGFLLLAVIAILLYRRSSSVGRVSRV